MFSDCILYLFYSIIHCNKVLEIRFAEIFLIFSRCSLGVIFDIKETGPFNNSLKSKKAVRMPKTAK